MEMDATAVAEIIQLIVAPVVMVIATAHILNAMLGRYRTLTNLLRMMAQERIQLRADRERTRVSFPELADSEQYKRIDEIDEHVPQVLNHHRQMHNAITFAYLSIALFIADMFMIALGAITMANWIFTIVLVLFLMGTTALFAGVVMAMLEVRSAHVLVREEVFHMSMIFMENDAMM